MRGFHDEWLSIIQMTQKLSSLLNKFCTTLLLVQLKMQSPSCIYCNLQQIRIRGELNIWTAKGKTWRHFRNPSANDVTVAHLLNCAVFVYFPWQIELQLQRITAKFCCSLENINIGKTNIPRFKWTNFRTRKGFLNQLFTEYNLHD